MIRSSFLRLPKGPLLHYWHWIGDTRPETPTILFCHGASFHGRCYDRIIREALAGYQVIAPDFRGHGRSEKYPPPYPIRWFGEDTLHLIEALGLSPSTPLIGIGHSLGGYALVHAASFATRPLFRALLLLDPTLFPPSLYGTTTAQNFDHIRRRKNQWSSVEEMFSKLMQREPFSRWPNDVLRDYCTYAVDDQCRLACSPDAEASIYSHGLAPEANIYSMIESAPFLRDLPVHIVRTSKFATAVDLVHWFPRGTDRLLEPAGHFFPMEQPDVAIDLVRNFLLSLSLHCYDK